MLEGVWDVGVRECVVVGLFFVCFWRSFARLVRVKQNNTKIMDYNTSRERLPMPEYGRNIQQMVDYALTIEDRDERTNCAATIANVILILFPQLKNDANYVQKVWDSIAMMANYRLDVDSPYPLPQRQEATVAPQNHIPYPMTRIRLRSYGIMVQNMLRSAVNANSEEERMATTALTALYMKRLILQNGKDSNVEVRVANDIADLTDGQLNYSFEELMDSLPDDQTLYPRQQWGDRHQQPERFPQNDGRYQQGGGKQRHFHFNQNRQGGGGKQQGGGGFRFNRNKKRY